MFSEILLRSRAHNGVVNRLLTLAAINNGAQEFSLEDFDKIDSEAGVYLYYKDGKVGIKIFNNDDELERLKKKYPIDLVDFLSERHTKGGSNSEKFIAVVDKFKELLEVLSKK